MLPDRLLDAVPSMRLLCPVGRIKAWSIPDLG